ncbi:MAG TPA: serine/threonine-protein kinase [Pyrinomonadaceae bacterium]|nr:serine/threonine-protein kinase [Pyrinomonadaceae bacterium]
MIEAGTLLQQRYRIDKQIGQGGMGAVYVSTDERFGSTVAIKETLCNDDNFRKALEREARLLNSLKHAALPRVTDHFEENEGLFIVMEFIPGDDLSVLLDRDQKPFPVETVQTWATQLLDALEFLHTQEIPVVHRDIKPQNLKVTNRGQIILLDFGLAKGNPTDAAHNTAAKSIFGYSRNYASLEQIQGTGTDPRSDIYSLAATLYHLVTGVAPEDALTRAMAVLSKRADPLVPANSIIAEIPKGFAGVLQRALDLDAAERPASASEMRQMLENSESFAHFADAVTVAIPAADAKVFGQQTKIMPEATLAEAHRLTDLKTEVLSEPVSQVTNIRSLADTDSPKPKRKGFAVAAGGLGLLLVGCVVAGGLYVARPDMFHAAPAVTTTDAAPKNDPKPETSEAVPSLVDSQSSTVANTNTVAVPDVSSDKSKPTDAQPKTGETAKTGQQTPKNDDPTDGEMVISSEDEDGHPVTVKQSADGRTTTVITKDGTYTTRDGTVVQRPRAPIPGRPPNFPQGIDPKKLTPEQRRKLRILMNDPNFRPPPDYPQKPTN